MKKAIPKKPWELPFVCKILAGCPGQLQLVVFFLHQHQSFSMWFTHLPLPAPLSPSLATQSSEKSRNTSEIFGSFLEVPDASNAPCDTEPAHLSTTVLCKSLLSVEGYVTTRARTLVDQDYDYISTTTQGHQLIMVDFISLSEELPNKKTSHFLLKEEFLTKKSSITFVLLWCFLCCFSYKNKCLFTAFTHQGEL